MAIDTIDSYQEFTADGQTAYFTFNFNYVDASEIVVGMRTGDNIYETVQPEYYQVIQNAATNGGQVRFISNPSGSEIVDNPIPAGTIVRIERRSPETSNATWQVGLEMSELVSLFDTLFRLVQENKGRFDNTIETFATQHGVKLYELLAEHTDKLLYWDNDTKTITPTDFPRQDVVRSVGGLFFRIKVDNSTNTPYLEWSQNGIDNWYAINIDAVATQAAEALEKAEQGIATADEALEKAEQGIADAAQAQKIADVALAVTYQLEASKANKTDVYDKQEADAKFQAETESRTQADAALQAQIDAQEARSDVVDVVGTYAELQAYDTSELTAEDVIKVLSDSTHDDAESYYRWHDGAWVWIGSVGPYYTKAEVDTKVAAVQTEINEISALPSVIDVVDSEDDLPTYSVQHQVVNGDVIIVRNYTGLVNDFTNTYADGEATAWRYNGGGWACIGILGSDAINKLKEKTSELQQDIDDNAGKTAELDADLQGKVDKDQGAENAGKFLKVGADGNVTLGEGGGGGGGGVTEVAHDDTLTGKGTTEEPLSVVKPAAIIREW